MTEVTELGGEVLEKSIEGVGDLRFENFEAGQWLTQKGEPAKVSKRRYLLNGEQVDSVSSIVETLDKPALVPWAEKCGAQGAVEAERAGKLKGVSPEDAIYRIRALGMGSDGVVSEAQERGTAIHDAFHALATTGSPPALRDYPEAWWPWIKGTARAWLKLDPEPIEAEFMVCHPQMGYAGRADLLATSKGQRVLIDYKTGKGRVYEQAHYQTRGYALAMPESLIEPPERIIIVGVGDDGHPNLVDCEATAEDWQALLHTFRSRKRVNAAIAAAKKVA